MGLFHLGRQAGAEGGCSTGRRGDLAGQGTVQQYLNRARTAIGAALVDSGASAGKAR